MSNNDTEATQQPTVYKHHTSEQETKLPTEIRLAIWAHLYNTTPARIVEVQTAKHDHYSHYPLPCPRYSPSPPPLLVNICHEARAEARRLALLAGHLLLPTASNSPDIYFNPAIDTLYIRTDKDYWIRGVFIQIREEPRLEPLRSMAVEMDHLTRVTAWQSFLNFDLLELTGLGEFIFVVKEVGEKEIALLKAIDWQLWSFVQNDRDNHQQRSIQCDSYRSRPERRRIPRAPGPREYPKCCKLATKRGTRFEFVDQELLKCLLDD
jgi:hypothetical protein